MKLRSVVFVAACAAVSVGCGAISSVQTADTVGAGNFQFAIEPGVQGLAGGGGSIIYPHFDLSGRYGISDTFDLGARIGSSLVEIQTKFLLTDPANESLAMSLAPNLGGVFIGTAGASVAYANLTVPYLIGIKTGGGSEFVLGPRLDARFLFGGASAGGTGASGGSLLLMAGTSVGFAAKLGSGFRLMPEIAAEVPVVGASAASAGGTGTSGASTVPLGSGVIFSFKLGLLFGGR